MLAQYSLRRATAAMGGIAIILAIAIASMAAPAMSAAQAIVEMDTATLLQDTATTSVVLD